MAGTAALDFGAQARIVARLAGRCPGYRARRPDALPRVHGLLGHLAGLAAAFRDAARKDLGVTTGTAPGHGRARPVRTLARGAARCPR